MTQWQRRLRGARGDERGFVAAELVLGVGLLLFPVALLVLTLPTWSERQATGRAIAREVVAHGRGGGHLRSSCRERRRPEHGGQSRSRSGRCFGRAQLHIGLAVAARRESHGERHCADPGRRHPHDCASGAAALDHASHRSDRPLPQLRTVRRAVRPRPDVHDGDARGECGTITLWILGLCLMLFALGGISLDLWRAFSDRRSLASAADAAAVVGGTALDVDAYRHDGVVQLDPALAKARGGSELARSGGYVGTDKRPRGRRHANGAGDGVRRDALLAPATPARRARLLDHGPRQRPSASVAVATRADTYPEGLREDTRMSLGLAWDVGEGAVTRYNFLGIREAVRVPMVMTEPLPVRDEVTVFIWFPWALLRCLGPCRAGLGLGVRVHLDRSGEFAERVRDAPIGARINPEFVVAAPNVLHQRVTAHDHSRRVGRV